MEPLAYTKKEILELKLLPWGRSRFEHDLASGLCPSFKRGRRKYISRDQLQEYIDKVSGKEKDE